MKIPNCPRCGNPMTQHLVTEEWFCNCELYKRYDNISKMERLSEDLETIYRFARDHCDLIGLNVEDTIKCNHDRLKYFIEAARNMLL